MANFPPYFSCLLVYARTPKQTKTRTTVAGEAAFILFTSGETFRLTLEAE